MSEIDSMMAISLSDAATNCARNGAIATLTLKSGVKFTGRLEKSNYETRTAHLKTEGGGWATILAEEVVGVEVRRR